MGVWWSRKATGTDWQHSEDESMAEALYNTYEDNVEWESESEFDTPPDTDGDPSLIRAARQGSLKRILHLVLKGDRVNHSNHKGYTALMEAAWHGHHTCVKTLIKAGADVNATDIKGADVYGFGKILIRTAADVNPAVAEPGSTALIRAASNGHTGCLLSLIQAGADVNAGTQSGYTALMFAVQNGYEKCVDELIEAGADVKQADSDGHQALWYAGKNGHGGCIIKLVKSGADVNASMGDNKETALMFAAVYGLTDCAEFLIKSGADVNAAKPSGNTALTCAAIHNEEKCGEFLIKAGADVNVVGTDKNTPLIITASEGNVALLNTLLQAGADVNTSNIEGRTALIEAVKGKNNHCLGRLIEAGADVNRSDSGSRSALNWAVRLCSEDCTRSLLKAGAEISKNNQLIHIAIRVKFARRILVQLLSAAGEALDVTTVTIPDYLKHNEDEELSLKHTCRETIRKHLMNLDSNVNLFSRVSQLGLPRPLAVYLLYDMIL